MQREAGLCRGNHNGTTSYTVLDLGIGSPLIAGDPSENAEPALSERLFARMDAAGARVGVGRYDEARLLYSGALFGPPSAAGGAPTDEAGLGAGSDEHGVVADPDGVLKVNDKLRLVPGHCDPTCNLHDWYVGVRGGKVETLWPVSARGKAF